MPLNYDSKKDAAQLRALSHEKLTWILILIANDLETGSGEHTPAELAYQQQIVTAELERRNGKRN